MADTKLSALSAASSLSGTDLFYVVQTAGAGGVKATLSQLNTLYAGLGANTFTSLQTITVGAANTGVLASTGYSLTGSDATSMVNLAGTWNTSGTPTAIKLNVTDTASNASSLLMDLQVGGTSKFKITKAGQTVAIAGTASAPGLIFSDDNNTGFYKSTGNIIDISIDGLQAHRFSANGYFFVTSAGSLNLSSAGSLTWGNGTAGSDTRDLTLYRDAAGTLAQRNGANAQKFRAYSTYTDASNYERAAINTTAGSQIEIAAETAGTGGDNLDVVLTPAGTGVVKFGSYTTLGAEALAGYITIKDAAGNTRKLAVIA